MTRRDLRARQQNVPCSPPSRPSAGGLRPSRRAAGDGRVALGRLFFHGLLTIAGLLGVASGDVARAHFVFVVPDANGSARVILSESLEHDPDVDTSSLARLQVEAERPTGGPMSVAVRTDADGGLRVDFPEGATGLRGRLDYGVMQRGEGKPFLLVYHPRGVLGDPFDARTPPAPAGGVAKPAGGATAGGADEHEASQGRSVVELVATGSPAAVRFVLRHDGRPVEGAATTVILPDGTTTSVTTDESGATPPFDSPGRYGVWARHVESVSGAFEGKPYEAVRHYPTLVVNVPPAAAAEDAASKSTLLAPLPVAASSLGAVALDGHLYAYGGHVAPVHTYSTEAVSGRFGRLALAGPAAWQSLPGGPGLQGMNLAAHGTRIYRVGGMAPHNPPGTDTDNRSTAAADGFDPETGRWEPLPDLPEPRSSHDVAVIGDTLYVVGGWNMRGDDGEDWFDSMVTLDLSDPTRVGEAAESGSWKTVPQPFRRRALIAAAHDGRLWVMGGFTDDEEMSLRVDVYDPAAGEWSRGPDLPGPDRNGFAPAACVAGGRLVVSVADGSLFALDDADGAWRLVGRASPRIVHRMVPDGTDAVVLVGGAAGRENLATVERIPID